MRGGERERADNTRSIFLFSFWPRIPPQMPLSLASSSTRMAAGLHRLASTSRGAAALRAVGRSAGLVPRRGGAMVFPRPALSRGLAVKASMVRRGRPSHCGVAGGMAAPRD